jgi:hypothetical protein
VKIALYIEDGLEQLVLTPETKYEDQLLEKMHDRERSMRITKGEFYSCVGPDLIGTQGGGYVRQGRGQTDKSTIVVLERKPADVE